MLALDEALGRLARLDPRQVRIVELRYLGGLSVEEAARTLGVSPATVKREWAVANAILSANLLFTSRINPAGLGRQLRRTRPSVVATDLLVNVVLVLAGLLLPDHLTPAVALAAAGIGNAAVAIWVEPATTEAAFPGSHRHHQFR